MFSSIVSITSRTIIVLATSLLLASCGSRLVSLDKVPNSVDLNGNWLFVSEDAATYDQFKYRAEAWTNRVMSEITARGLSRTAIEESQPNRLILDVLISLLTLPRKEIYFRQTNDIIEVDYGVAGYHSFPIGSPTEMLLARTEFDAMAGWQTDEIVIHILVTSEFDIFNRFKPMDENNLLETIEIRLSDSKTLSHQRWYRRAN